MTVSVSAGSTSRNTSRKALETMAGLLTFEQNIRSRRNIKELGQLLVNETRHLVDYHCALFFYRDKVAEVSGLPEPVKEAPLIQWSQSFYRYLKQECGTEAQIIDYKTLPEGFQDSWSGCFPEHRLWLPLSGGDGQLQAALLLAGTTPFRSEQLTFLEHMSGCAGHSLEALQNRKTVRFNPRTIKKLPAVIAAAVGLALFIPVPQSALAPAEIVASETDVVRSPLDGIVGDIHVEPNQSVKKGELLISLDDRSLKANLDVARQSMEMALAEYRQAQQATNGRRSVDTPLPVLKARIDQSLAKTRYLESQLQQVEIRAEQAGVVILDDPEVLEGKPVNLGEKLLAVAAPESAEVEIWLPVEESLPLPDSAEINLFLNVQPAHALEGSVRYINYQAEVSSEGILAFRGRAALSSDEVLPRLGWRGTARVKGYTVPLYYYLFRRPFSAVRQWMGV